MNQPTTEAKQEKKPKAEVKTETKAVAKAPDKIDKAMAIYDPKADEGWQILDTGEGRLYWHLDPDANPDDPSANAITGFAMDVSSYEQEDPRDGEMKTRHFIKAQTTAPCMVVGEQKDERGVAIPFVAPKGSLVWIGVRHALMDLYNKVKSSAYMLEIQVRGVERIVLPGTSGQKVWRIAQAMRVTKRRALVVRPTLDVTAQPAGTDEGVPF